MKRFRDGEDGVLEGGKGIPPIDDMGKTDQDAKIKPGPSEEILKRLENPSKKPK